MTPDNDASGVPPAPLTAKDRREFLTRARDLAITAPAAALLLQAATKPAQAANYGQVTTQPPQTTTEGFPSDRRLKTDVVRIGRLPNGLDLYSFRYIFSRERFVGVMADEVEALMPAAVSVHRSGYKLVNYAMVLG
jgi:hypothetical protein